MNKDALINIDGVVLTKEEHENLLIDQEIAIEEKEEIIEEPKAEKPKKKKAPAKKKA